MPLALSRPDADVFVPAGVDALAMLAKVTHLGIAAHADDLEIMAYHGIRAGAAGPDTHFGGVVCTDGRGAPRTGPFAALDDDAMRRVRRDEQRDAARRGGYAVAIQLDHGSDAVKEGVAPEVITDLAAVIDAAAPEVVYTHNPMDAHATHLGVCAATVDAIRALPEGRRPRRVLGCEGWRGLDWLDDGDKTRLELGSDDREWSALIRSFASQVEGGRPYDEGALGRARANAVFDATHDSGGHGRLWLAVDLTPVIADGGDLEAFVRERLSRFQQNLLGAIARVRG